MIECPKCGDEAPTKDSLRNHANALTDHDWADIKAELTTEDDPNDQPDDQEETETPENEQGDSSAEQAETDENSENDQTESSESEQGDMVSQEELEKQRQTTSQTSSENSQTATTETTSQSSQSSKGIPLPVPRSWLLAAAVLLAFGLIGAWVMQGDDQPEPADDEPDNLGDGTETGLIPE